MPTLYDIIKNIPVESLCYEKEFEIDDIEYEIEHEFLSIIDITNQEEKMKLILIGIEIGLSPCLENVKVFLITDNCGKTCKFAYWG